MATGYEVTRRWEDDEEPLDEGTADGTGSGTMAGPYTRREDAERVRYDVLREQQDWVAGLRPGDLGVREVSLIVGDRVFDLTLGCWLTLDGYVTLSSS